jgi:Myosin head (motor domain)
MCVCVYLLVMCDGVCAFVVCVFHVWSFAHFDIFFRLFGGTVGCRVCLFSLSLSLSLSSLRVGFEYFKQNGFEQFLINYCNEKIQQYFTVQILQQEQEIYMKEGLRWRKVEVPNSFDTLELIEAKRSGILPLLEESCILPRATDQSFTLRVHKQHFNHASLMKPSSSLKDVPGIGSLKLTQEEAFIVRHFAADVCYQTTGFLEKNNDTLHSDLLLLMSNKAGDFVSMLFKAGGIAGTDQPRSRFGTLSGTFLSGISDLMARLSTTSSNFIRCINPNEVMKPALINSPACMTQLRCSGMLEALVIMQAGYPTRCLFTDLHARYYDLMPKEISRLKPRTFCEALLVALDLVGYCIVLLLVLFFLPFPGLIFLRSCARALSCSLLFCCSVVLLFSLSLSLSLSCSLLLLLSLALFLCCFLSLSLSSIPSFPAHLSTCILTLHVCMVALSCIT